MWEQAHDAEHRVMCSEEFSSEYYQEHQISPLDQHTDSWLNLVQGSPRVVSSGCGYRNPCLTQRWCSLINEYIVCSRFGRREWIRSKIYWLSFWNCSKIETHLSLELLDWGWSETHNLQSALLHICNLFLMCPLSRMAEKMWEQANDAENRDMCAADLCSEVESVCSCCLLIVVSSESKAPG